MGLLITENQIGDAGATVLASHVKDLPNLSFLFLGGNPIGEAGATALRAVAGPGLEIDH